MAVGEVFGTAQEVADFYGSPSMPRLHLAFNFQFIHEREPIYTPWEAGTLRRIVRNAEAALPDGAQPCYALANHDRSRFISRHNADGHGLVRARAATVMLLTLRNTHSSTTAKRSAWRMWNIPEDRLQKNTARYRSIGRRDPERTPMQWDGNEGRGFSTGQPWLPYGRIDRNVAARIAARTRCLR